MENFYTFEYKNSNPFLSSFKNLTIYLVENLIVALELKNLENNPVTQIFTVISI